MDFNEYKLVFEDCFEGETLDTSKWEYRLSGSRRCGFNGPEQVSVRRGNLILKQEYRENGSFGPGWYGGMIRAKQKFLRGYFEIRCICSDCLKGGFWSAFWLQADHPYEAALSCGGPGGAEIDIMEAYGNSGYDSNVHVAGKDQNADYSDGHIDSLNVVRLNVPDCFTAYHTYACEWTEDSYRFYLDGKLTGETSWGSGVSTVPEELIVSLELPGSTNAAKDQTSEMIVDYVRVYQKQ